MTVSNEHNATRAGSLRVGLIGAGRIVERVHLPVVAALPGVTVAGIYDLDVARAREVAANGDGGQACRSLKSCSPSTSTRLWSPVPIICTRSRPSPLSNLVSMCLRETDGDERRRCGSDGEERRKRRSVN